MTLQENEDKEYRVANFATFLSRTPIPPPLPKWMNLISNWLGTAPPKNDENKPKKRLHGLKNYSVVVFYFAAERK